MADPSTPDKATDDKGASADTGSAAKPYRQSEVAGVAIAAAATKVSEKAGLTALRGTILLTADSQLTHSFATARQVEAAIDLQLKKARALLPSNHSLRQGTPEDGGVKALGWLPSAGDVKTLQAIIAGTWTGLASILTTKVETISADQASSQFDTLAAVLGALPETASVLLDEEQIPREDAPLLKNLAVLQEVSAQLKTLSKTEKVKVRVAALVAATTECDSFLTNLEKIPEDGSATPMEIAISRLGLGVSHILIVQPAKASVQQNKIGQFARADQYVVDGFASISYVLISNVRTARAKTTGGIVTGAVRYLATFGGATSVAEWKQIKDVQPTGAPPPLAALLQGVSAVVAAIILVGGFSLPFEVNRYPAAHHGRYLLLKAEPFTAANSWQMLLLLLPVLVCLLPLLARGAGARLSFFASAAGATAAVLVGVLQLIEFGNSHLLAAVFGAWLPAALLVAASAPLYRAWRSAPAIDPPEPPGPSATPTAPPKTAAASTASG